MMHKKSGMGLLEMMIALMLSLFLLSVISKAAFFLESALAKESKLMEALEQYHVMFAWVIHDIEIAGYLGCVKARSRASIWHLDQYAASTWLTIQPHTLSVQYMSLPLFLVLKKENNQVWIEGPASLHSDDVLVLENCAEAEIAKIKAIHVENHGAMLHLDFYLPLMLADDAPIYLGKLISRQYSERGGSLIVHDVNTGEDAVLDGVRSLDFILGNPIKVVFTSDFSETPLSLSARKYND